MNIFILDYDPTTCAQYHNDKHVVKMILESAQMLSTACRLSGIDAGYKSTHINHPCNIWVRDSIYNWVWLRSLAYALNQEWRYRYNHKRNHKSWNVIRHLPYPDLPDKGITRHAQAMPDKYRDNSAITAYRGYYIGEKSDIAHWTKREIPFWYK